MQAKVTAYLDNDLNFEKHPEIENLLTTAVDNARSFILINKKKGKGVRKKALASGRKMYKKVVMR